MGDQAGARFYPAAYTQDHLDTLQDRVTAYQLARQKGGDPEGWFQMLRGQPPRSVQNSAQPSPIGHATALPNEHRLPYPSHMEGDDIVVTGPGKAERDAMRQAYQNPALFRELGRIIGIGEGGYESYNSGTRGIPGGAVGYHSLNPPAGTVTGRTINEVLSTGSLPATDPHRMNVVGRHQISRANLAGAMAAMRLSGNEQLTPELQDRIFAEYLVPHTPALANFMFHRRGTVDDAQYATARQWASIAVPRGRLTQTGRVSDGTMTYYDRGRANRANPNATSALRTYLTNLNR